MERYYKAYITASQKEQLKAAMCTPIFDFIWGAVLTFGAMNVAGLNLIWGKNPVIQGMGTIQVLVGGGALAIKYLGGVCR